MANKRTLKKTINYICSDLFAECVAASLYSGKPALLTSILSIQSDFIRRISHTEPGMKNKVYFQNFMKDFNKQVSEIIDQIGNLH